MSYTETDGREFSEQELAELAAIEEFQAEVN